MKKSPLILISIFLVAAATTAQGFWGKKTEALPDQRDVVRKALLWVPDTAALNWDALRTFLEDRRKARFTIALAPEEIPESATAWLVAFAAENRIEIALRIPGDPILPLASAGRPRLGQEKIALSRFRYKKIFGSDPAGFVPGGGALRPSDAKGFPRLGIRWTAVGDGEFSNAWYGDEQLVLVPFHSILSTDKEQLPPSTDTAALVIDEAAGAIPPGTGLAVIEALIGRSGDEAYAPVSEELAAIRPYVVGPQSWPTWRGTLSYWNESPAQKLAWNLYHAAAREVSDYQNSGSASIQRLNKAEAALEKARASRNFVGDNLREPAVEKNFRGALTAAYKAIYKRAPKQLSRAIAAPEEQPGPDEHNEPKSDLFRGDVLVEVEADRITFTNPEGSEGALPASLPALEPGTTASHLWTPRLLEVSWNESTVDFRLGIEHLQASEQAPFGFDHLIVDLYIDLNHLSGRGSTALLARRQGFLNPDDAWEFVLVVSGFSSGLYRSLPGHPPARIAVLEPNVDFENGTITLSVPRTRLRGNPAAWGYVMTTMAPHAADDDATGPPLPAAGQSGSPLLGMLGSLDEQRDLTTKQESTYRRFSAQRSGRPNQ